MQPGDLTTLQDVKDWLGITANTSDAALSRLITSLSAAIRTEINRYSLVDQMYTEIRNGTGTDQMVLNNWPVSEVLSVMVGNSVIRPGITTGQSRTAGYYLSPYDGNPPGNAQTVQLLGSTYLYGVQNVKISYRAGYRTVEPFMVPDDPFTYTTLQPQGIWTANTGVIYADTGVPLTLVTGSPSVGQYALTAVLGQYLFSAADLGASLIVTYSFVPNDLNDACMEWVAERNVYRTRIGLRSKSLASQESMSYDLSSVPAFVMGRIMPYANVMPIL